MNDIKKTLSKMRVSDTYTNTQKILIYCVFILCCISLGNTAAGLHNYVFENNTFVAILISLVMQSVVAVYSFNIVKFNEKRIALKKESKAKSAIAFFLVFILPIGAFVTSIVFDYVFISGSAYKIHADSVAQKNIQAEMSEMSSGIYDMITPLINESESQLNKNITTLYSISPKTGSGLYDKDWKGMWEEEGLKYKAAAEKPELSIIAVKVCTAVAKRKDDDDIAKLRKPLDDYTKNYFNDYMRQAVKWMTIFSPDSIRKDDMDTIIGKLLNIRAQIQKAELPSVSKDNTNEKDGWKKAVKTEIIELEEAQRNGISRSKEECIEEIDRYIAILNNISSEARYNIAVLVDQINKESLDQDEIEETMNKINSAIIGSNNSENEGEDTVLSQTMLSFTNIRKILSVYKILRNIDYTTKNFNLSTEIVLLEDDNSEYVVTGQEKASEVPEKNEQSTEIPSADPEEGSETQSELKIKPDEYDGKSTESDVFNRKAARKNIDLLISLISGLPSNTEEIIESSGESSSSVKKAGKSDSKSEISDIIEDLNDIRAEYLTDRNALTEAFDRLSDKWQEGKGLAWYCLVFAFILDAFSLGLGIWLQLWKQKNRKKQNKDSQPV